MTSLLSCMFLVCILPRRSDMQPLPVILLRPLSFLIRWFKSSWRLLSDLRMAARFAGAGCMAPSSFLWLCRGTESVDLTRSFRCVVERYPRNIRKNYGESEEG
eukprot:Pompholyxophrys_punicea_v1_NODE_230_length_2663_cov_7.318896.p6 type:complete len:103 gc:universal NODE_230_length_2663_cov_7.318896:914-1222(+)